ncbi:MAG: hypothetical protein NZ571_08835 [Anaerolineae bacterium]|nr:hypothetical protein [Anaerolineae bacterium]
MQYILLDPFVLYVAQPSQLTREAAKQYLEVLVAWSEALERRRGEVIFSISNKCREALEKSSGYPKPSCQKLDQLIGYHNLNLNVKDFYAGCQRFFQTLLESHPVDDRVREAQAEMDWETYETQVIPDELLARLQQLDSNLAQAFREMLADVAFARENDILPVSALREVCVGSSKSSEEPLEVITRCNVLHASSSSDILTKQLSTTLHILGPEQIQTEPPPHTFIQAVEQVEKAHPKHIVISNKAKNSAARAPREITPLRLKELLTKLVTVWLASHERGGGTHNQDYWVSTGKRCAQDESFTVKGRYPEDYIVTFEGKEVFCGRHVIVSYSFRINFEVVDSADGTRKILVALIGKHGRNTQS